VHHSSTSTYTPNFIEIKETSCGRTDVRTHVRTYGRTFETGFIRLTLSKSRPKNAHEFLPSVALLAPLSSYVYLSVRLSQLTSR